MAIIGQVVYNLHDFHSSGGLVSTDGANPSRTVTSESDGYENSRLNIFKYDLVKYFNAQYFVKLGIQAPPGTKVILDGNKTIMIGRTGVYELDEDLKIASLKFIRPYKYIVNQTLTQQALQAGMSQLNDAKTWLQREIDELDRNNPVKNESYWSKYVTIQNEYLGMYDTALKLYNQGVNGIYQLPFPDDETDERNYAEVYDVIVDFLY